MSSLNQSFWQGKRVLLTGHTGFKGAWLAQWLSDLGAKVSGFSLAPDTNPNLYQILQTPFVHDIHGDLRDVAAVDAAVSKIDPEIVLHLAAQALVRKSYSDPLDTIGSNVMGTATLLNALRKCEKLLSVLVVTSDKAYENEKSYTGGSNHKFVESDPVGGHDPYSASKGMQELVTKSFYDSYFAVKNIPVSTARAGNVIGGGDWAEDRLMTDIIASISRNEPVLLRNPQATRPWQHVLEPLGGYLIFAQMLAKGKTDYRAMNFGPDGSDTVLQVVETMVRKWNASAGWQQDGEPSPKEAATLELSSELAKLELGWQPMLDLDETLGWIVDWYKAMSSDNTDQNDVIALTKKQIKQFQERMEIL